MRFKFQGYLSLRERKKRKTRKNRVFTRVGYAAAFMFQLHGCTKISDNATKYRLKMVKTENERTNKMDLLLLYNMMLLPAETLLFRSCCSSLAYFLFRFSCICVFTFLLFLPSASFLLFFVFQCYLL